MRWGLFSTYSMTFDRLDAIVRSAVVNAKRGGQEICDLLVAHATRLTPIPLRNNAKRGGSWAFYSAETRAAVEKVKGNRGEGVGTFHSHPVGIAEPGESDVANAPDDSLMLVIDCTVARWSLWHIRRGKARRVRLVRRKPPRVIRYQVRSGV